MKNFKNTLPSLRIRAMYNSFSKTGRNIADYILQAPERVLKLAIAELALETKSSEATIMRFCKQLEYDGYSELKLMISQELGGKNSARGGKPAPDDGDTIIGATFRDIIESLEATRACFNEDELFRAVAALEKADCIDIYGVANSASVGDDLMNKLLRLGKRSRVYGDRHLLYTNAVTVSKGDVIVAISHSGMTREIVEATAIAKERGAVIIAITNFCESMLSKNADILLLTGDHESHFYSETMVSRISQLAIIDCIFKALFERNQTMQDNIQSIKLAQKELAY